MTPMTRNRLAWIASKGIVFGCMAVSVCQGMWRMFQDMREAGSSVSVALAASSYILLMCSLGASLLWSWLFRNDPYR